MTDPYYTDNGATVYHGDCIEIMRELPDASVDAVVTDPPYGLANTDPGHVIEALTKWATGDREFIPTGRGFMGKAWDSFVPPPAVWDEAMRVLKPGGHLLAFAGSRTHDLMTLSIRFAGFDIRDSIAWLYGSGFPKSLDVAKAIEKVRDDTDRIRVVCRYLRALIDAKGGRPMVASLAAEFGVHTRMIEHWAARETDSQPACPTVDQFARLMVLLGADPHPAISGAVAELNDRKGQFGEAFSAREVTGEVEEWTDRTNYALTSRDGKRRDKASTEQARAWEGWGTALKPAFEPIVVARKPLAGTVAANVLVHGTGALNIDATRTAMDEDLNGGAYAEAGSRAVSGSLNPSGMNAAGATTGREFQQPSGRWPTNVILDETQAADLDAQTGVLTSGKLEAHHTRAPKESGILGAYGSADGARGYGDSGGASRFFPTFRYEAKATTDERPDVDGVQHPTVKPLDLMRWLVRLVTPPTGTVLEPFAGSGTTIEAALLEGFSCIGIKREETYLPLIMQRIKKPLQQGLFGDWEN